MSNLEVRTTARLEYADEGRDLAWRFFYKEDIVELRAQLKQAQEELLVAKRNVESWQETAQQAQETIDGMRREGCAAIGLVQNIFNGLTAPSAIKQGASFRVQQEMADACAKLLFEATSCNHKERADDAEKHLRLIVSEAEGMPEEGLARAIERAEAAEERGKLLWAWLDYYVYWFIRAKHKLRRLK